ncbi:PAS domain S-box protein [Haloterrigena alkaliphila]|uniref:histidine kinase n=1 Tax=Haloterrigena alkaliphila TaxID=2816475 RepID=A0A8A2VF54_9EURY|nr:PAS domain S-box protein [Haloterrigena alkaliphila]QSW98982.1 PAS domain S-box protein [Haloterrigena alkaliphila]
MTKAPPADADSTVHTRIRQQEVVAELGQQALETGDLEQLMRDAASAIAETLETEYAHVLELCPGGEAVVLRHGVGWPDDLVGSATVPTGPDSQAGYTLHSERPVIVDDLRTEDRFSSPELLTDRDVVSGISVVVGSTEDPWGVLGTHTTERRTFTKHDANFVQSVANVLAAALEEARTKRKLRERESELEETFDRITDAFIGLDQDWDITYINNRGAELLDPEDQGLVGENFWDPFEPALGTTFEEEYRKTMATQEPTSFEEYYPPLGIWFEVHAYPSESGLSIYFRDVTERKEREQKLEESERRYRTLAEHFPNGIVTMFDEDLRYTLAAGQGFDEFPISSADAEGEAVEEVWPEHVADALRPAFRAALDGEQRVVEAEYVGREWVVHVVPLTDDQGTVFGGMTIAQDITERKEREQALEESEAKFRMLAENLEEMVWISDPETRAILYINPAYETIVGRDRESLYDDPTSFLDAVHPEDQPRMNDIYAEIPTSEFDEEYRIVRPDGEVRWLHGRTVPVRNGGLERIVGIAEDITERKEHERALEESERRYRTLVENFPNGAVGLFDEDLRYTVVGGELLAELGLTSDERVGTTVADVYPDEIVDEVEPHFEAALEGAANSFEVQYHDRDLFAHTVPVRNADDEIYAGMLVVQDVTERREYQRKLEASNERLEQFAYAASHDLQEPLRMVSSYLSLIDHRYGDDLDADGEEFLEYAVDGADRMREMIDGLLAYSRVDTQGDPLEPVELDAVIDDALENLQVMVEEHDAEIAVENLPRVEADESQLRQVFQNLVSNAIEYSGDEPPRIRVEAERSGRKQLISVHDEGIGIDPEDQDRVFEVFQRLHSREEHAGAGIGLALCQRIVERHGGRIWVDSEPGEGTTFSFTLPTATE